MPKLDDYDDSHASNPISASAQTSIATKVSSGTSTLTTAASTTPTTGGFGSASTTTGSFASSGTSTFGSAPAGGFGGSSSSFGSNTTPGASSFGSSTGGFGSSSGGFGSPSGFGSAPGGMTGGMPNSQAASLQSTGGAMQEGGVAAIETSKGFGDFINSKWRPMMAVIYMITCTTDFVLFPVLWSILQAYSHGQVTSQWQPLTLQGAGLYHIAMGAVLGLAAYGRSQEKIAGKA